MVHYHLYLVVATLMTQFVTLSMNNIRVWSPCYEVIYKLCYIHYMKKCKIVQLGVCVMQVERFQVCTTGMVGYLCQCRHCYE
jgi:hypothetical protein